MNTHVSGTPEYRKSGWMRFGASLMLAWATWGMPVVWSVAYAQSIPGQVPTTAQTQAATLGRTQDEATSDTLINQRAARMLRSRPEVGEVRSPRILDDSAPVRRPRILADDGGEGEALQQAAKIPVRTKAEMVTGAQSGSIIGQGAYGQADVGNKSLRTDRAEPGLTQTNDSRVNATEIMPGFTQTEAARQTAMGNALYNNPESLKGLSEQNKRNLRRDGCRRTQFVLLQKQQIIAADASADQRILKVEFFDLVKQAIPGTNPVEYQIFTQPSTYKRGTVNMSVATLGGSSTVWWDKVDESFAIRYTYTPYTSPKGRNYFTYDHWFGLSYGSGVQRVPNPGMASYGGPDDGWKTAAGFTVPYGVTAAYLSADLYQAETTFTKQVEGSPCPPDPPQLCEVRSTSGELVRWCPGSFGANIVLMYDDQLNPDDRKVGKGYNDMLALNASRKDYRSDPEVQAGVLRGINAPNSDKAKELIGSCRRDSVARMEIDQGKPYTNLDVSTCSETLINPFPNGGNIIKRSFGLAYVGEHNYLTAKAFLKTKVPVVDPATGAPAKDSSGNPVFTYQKTPTNLTGPIRTDFSIMGADMCSGGACSTERDGYSIEYIHTPMGGDSKTFAFDRVYVQGGGTGTFTHYGKPDEDWVPTGSAAGDGSLHEVRLMAKAYSVPINAFAGADKYVEYVADGFCRGGKLTCLDTSPTRNVGGVTFGPGMANDGIVDILKKWGTESSAVFPDYDNGDSPNPTPSGPGTELLADRMCWEARGEAFTSCATMDDEGGSLKRIMKGDQQWATDCHIQTDIEDKPLLESTMCKREPQLDTCDSRFEGLYTGVCYTPTLAYNCGEVVKSKLPVIVEELGDSCTGAMRCLGTECHRPNLHGGHGGEFAQAVSNMEALNFMINEMVCDETGEAPTSPTQQCTPVVFGGKPQFCKLPIGRQIGLTPNCCKDAMKAAGQGGPNWIDYLQGMYTLYKITQDEIFKKFMTNFDSYNSTSKMFGEVSRPITDIYNSASSWVTENVVRPFTAGFDNLYGEFAKGGSIGSSPANIAVDSVDKMPSIGGMIDGFKQILMNNAYDLLQRIGGQELAEMFFKKTAGNIVSLSENLQNFLFVLQVYSLLRLIGHIVFACKKEEYDWGMNEKWRLTTYVDTCCSKKVLVCVENRQLYCSYKSIASRVIAEQIIKKNLTGNRPYGYRTGIGGGRLQKCDINCSGFTPIEIASVDWSRVDLTEWTDSLVESGLFTPADPRSNFGVSQNEVQSTMTVGRVEVPSTVYDQRIPAVKTAEGWRQNSDTLADFTETLREDDVEHCYDPASNAKMPFTYPGCRTEPKP